MKENIAEDLCGKKTLYGEKNYMRSPIPTRRPCRGPMRREELLKFFYVEKNFFGIFQSEQTIYGEKALRRFTMESSLC